MSIILFFSAGTNGIFGKRLAEKVISGSCVCDMIFSELLSACKIVLDCFSHGNGQVWSLHVTMSDMDMATESPLKFVHD